MPPVEVPAAVLTQEQRDQIGEYLSSPLKYPPEFKQWLTDYLATNIPPIPVSQLMGYKGTLARYDFEATFSDGNTSPERTWTTLDGLGPVIDQLADGIYWAVWGYHHPGLNAGSSTQRMGLSVNGAAPLTWTESITLDTGKTIWRADRLDVSGGNDNNTVEANYWFDLAGGADGEFSKRWMALLRIT